MMKSEIPSPRRQPCIDATSRSPIQTAHPANSTDPYIKVPLELKLQVKLPRCVGERSYVLLIKVLLEDWTKMRCPTCKGGRTVGAGCGVGGKKADRAGPSRTLRSSERIAAQIADAGQEIRRQRLVTRHHGRQNAPSFN